MSSPHAPNSTDTDESWDEIKTRLQRRWGQIDDDDLKQPMSLQQLSDMIQSKTGEARDQVEGYLEEMRASLLAKADGLRQTFGPKVSDMQAQAAARFDGANQSFREGLSAAEAQVRSKPGQSLGIAFGVGILAGIMLGTSRRS